MPSLLVSLINSITMSVVERIPEPGMLRNVGARPCPAPHLVAEDSRLNARARESLKIGEPSWPGGG